MSKKVDAFYFNSFAQGAETACEAAELLRTSIEDFHPDEMTAVLMKMHDIENAGDKQKHVVMSRLVREFIAPIEREDIIKICENIDNVTDSIEDVLIKFYTNNVQIVREGCVAFAELVAACCRAVKELMDEFPNFRKSQKLKKIIVEINRLEEEGDKLYLDSLRALHTSKEDMMTILIWREIFECLERCCDACEDVADVVEGIAIGNT